MVPEIQVMTYSTRLSCVPAKVPPSNKLFLTYLIWFGKCSPCNRNYISMLFRGSKADTVRSTNLRQRLLMIRKNDNLNAIVQNQIIIKQFNAYLRSSLPFLFNFVFGSCEKKSVCLVKSTSWQSAINPLFSLILYRLGPLTIKFVQIFVSFWSHIKSTTPIYDQCQLKAARKAISVAFKRLDLPLIGWNEGLSKQKRSNILTFNLLFNSV